MAKFSVSIKASAFLSIGKRITHRTNERCYAKELERYRAFFGISPSNTSLLWAKIREKKLAPRASPVHLLWGLLFLKVYSTESIIAGFLGVDEGTYQEWSCKAKACLCK